MHCQAENDSCCEAFSKTTFLRVTFLYLLPCHDSMLSTDKHSVVPSLFVKDLVTRDDLSFDHGHLVHVGLGGFLKAETGM